MVTQLIHRTQLSIDPILVAHYLLTGALTVLPGRAARLGHKSVVIVGHVDVEDGHVVGLNVNTIRV